MNRAVTDVYHALKKPDLFAGFHKSYQSLRSVEDGGDQLPPESKIVQLNAEDLLADLAQLFTLVWDIEATKDAANMNAKADITLDGTVLVHDVPVQTLLYLQKQFEDVRSELRALPVLDPSERWLYDDNRGVWVTAEPVRTQRTKQLPAVLVLYPATKEHPAQTQSYQDVQIEGHWTNLRFSGAVPADRKKALLARIDALLEAIKTAREEANRIDAPSKTVGQPLFEFLLAT